MQVVFPHKTDEYLSQGFLKKQCVASVTVDQKCFSAEEIQLSLDRKKISNVLIHPATCSLHQKYYSLCVLCNNSQYFTDAVSLTIRLSAGAKRKTIQAHYVKIHSCYFYINFSAQKQAQTIQVVKEVTSVAPRLCKIGFRPTLFSPSCGTLLGLVYSKEFKG